MATKLHSKVEAASTLSTNILTMEWSQVLSHLKEPTAQEVEASTTFHKQFLKTYVQQHITDFETIIEA
eukprot:8098645-Pyramimonas_sp.AAC.1